MSVAVSPEMAPEHRAAPALRARGISKRFGGVVAHGEGHVVQGLDPAVELGDPFHANEIGHRQVPA